MDRKEVIQNLQGIKSYLVAKSFEKSSIPKEALEITKVAFMESIKTIDCTINLLREQEETIKNLEQEIRDKNIRLKERAEQVDSMLKEKEAIEPRLDANCVRIFRCGVCGEYVGFIDSDTGDHNEQDNYCRNCGKAVKWNE